MSADSDDALGEIICDSGMLLIADPMRIPAWVDLTEGVLADIGGDHRNDPPARVIELGSAWATIVWAIPPGPIRLIKRGEAHALKCVDLIFDDDEEDEPGEPMGVVGVDTGVIAVGDAHALGSWIADRPLDGLWGVTFWGIDQREHVRLDHVGIGEVDVVRARENLSPEHLAVGEQCAR
jgi:hypothetical protein